MRGFECKTKIMTGRGVTGQLRELGLSGVMIVTDPFFTQNGVAQRIARESGATRTEIFDQVAPDPGLELVAQGVAAAGRFRPDGIIALGGGSAMDCAKGIRYFLDERIPLIAIPTTSGSGSEVTDFAILTYRGVKHPLVDASLRPEIAVLDGDLVTALPASLVADGGFDVLTHAVEAWGGKNANGFTDALAQSAFTTVFRDLSASFHGDVAVRLGIHEASCMAGLAFSKAGLGLCHAVSHALGGQFHIPHGRLNGILLPAVIDCNARHDPKRYGELARRTGLGGSSDAVALRNLKNGLIRLRAALSMPESLVQGGVRPAALREKMDDVVAAALADPCCTTNPVPVTREMVLQVLHEVMGRG